MSNGIVQRMTLTEAQTWKIRVGSAANQLRALLFEGYERGAWEVLGYASWTECVKQLAQEYRFSESYIWRLHAANQTEKRVTLDNCPVGTIPESHLRPLTKLAPATQRAAYQTAVSTAPNGTLTAAHVAATARVFAPRPTRPAPLPVNAKPVLLTPSPAPQLTDMASVAALVGCHAGDLVGKKHAHTHGLKLCECGRVATKVGLFTQTFSTGAQGENACWLCDCCARHADAGVTLHAVRQPCHECGQPATYVGVCLAFTFSNEPRQLCFDAAISPLRKTVLVCAGCVGRIGRGLTLLPLYPEEHP